MANLLKGLFGSQAAPSPASALEVDADFADFVDAPAPTPVVATSHSVESAVEAAQTFGSSSLADRPYAYTKWYDIHKRTSLSDFYIEMFLVPVVLLSVILHFWGTKRNRSTARRWMSAYKPLLEAEYSQVGFKHTIVGHSELSEDKLFSEKSKHTFLTYATGRQNVAFLDVQLQLHKRENALALAVETALGFLFETIPAPEERVVLTAQTFDGQEAQLTGSSEGKGRDSAHDGFVWAIVHKDSMKKLRDDRFDLSITSTKEHAKLPFWATIMSESAEITDTLLTPELIKAVESCGESLEALIVTDLPEEAPKTLADLSAKKRLTLSLRLDKGPEQTEALVKAFLRLPDQLVGAGHFRSEVMRRVKTTREDVANRIRKTEDEAKAEERKTETDKAKKEERDRKVKAMKPDEQRKFLDKEREREQKKRQGKRTIKA